MEDAFCVQLCVRLTDAIVVDVELVDGVLVYDIVEIGEPR